LGINDVGFTIGLASTNVLFPAEVVNYFQFLSTLYMADIRNFLILTVPRKCRGSDHIQSDGGQGILAIWKLYH